MNASKPVELINYPAGNLLAYFKHYTKENNNESWNYRTINT